MNTHPPIPRMTAAVLLSSALAIATGATSVMEATPGTGWERVPVNLFFAKRSGAMTEAELDFVAGHSHAVTLNSGHGSSAFGSTEEGIAETARRLRQRNPGLKVLFYLNAFVNRTDYAAYRSYRDEWTLRSRTGEVVTIAGGATRPDPSNREFREWWANLAAAEMRRGPVDGVFADALPQALGPALARTVGDDRARAVVAGLREMLALAKRRMGPGKIILANGVRSGSHLEILDWPEIDGVYIEHFDSFHCTDPEQLRADIDTLALAAGKGKFAVLKGWPGFTWLDKEMMKRPHAELLDKARANVTFPLACFLVGARPGSQFCYAWGYVDMHGMLASYPEFERPLGAPKADASWNGLTATREFGHASVWVDLVAKRARIDWKP